MGLEAPQTIGNGYTVRDARRAKDIPSCATCKFNTSPYREGRVCSSPLVCGGPDYFCYTYGRRVITKVAPSATLEIGVVALASCAVFGLAAYALVWLLA